jgi:hypothetical protein
MHPTTHLALAHTIATDRVRAADNARRARPNARPRASALLITSRLIALRQRSTAA